MAFQLHVCMKADYGHMCINLLIIISLTIIYKILLLASQNAGGLKTNKMHNSELKCKEKSLCAFVKNVCIVKIKKKKKQPLLKWSRRLGKRTLTPHSTPTPDSNRKRLPASLTGSDAILLSQQEEAPLNFRFPQMDSSFITVPSQAHTRTSLSFVSLDLQMVHL